MTQMSALIQDREVVTRKELVVLLNEDLVREYQAVISYIVHSQVLHGAQYMMIAAELERHAFEELGHALQIAGQIDYLGGNPVTTALPVAVSIEPGEMLQLDLAAEVETIRHYRQRVRQCEELGELALADRQRDILVEEQDHLVALASALGVEIPDTSQPVSVL